MKKCNQLPVKGNSKKTGTFKLETSCLHSRNSKLTKIRASSLIQTKTSYKSLLLMMLHKISFLKNPYLPASLEDKNKGNRNVLFHFAIVRWCPAFPVIIVPLFPKNDPYCYKYCNC